jgi:uncharacterized PurR-regulated membrane protein YhhQ (DUF165 family)
VWFDRTTVATLVSSMISTVVSSIIATMSLRKDDRFIYIDPTTPEGAPDFAGRLVFGDLGRTIASLDVTCICFELFKLDRVLSVLTS